MSALGLGLLIAALFVLGLVSIFGTEIIMLRHIRERRRGRPPFYPWMPSDEHRMVDPDDLTESWDRRDWKLEPPDGRPWPAEEGEPERPTSEGT